MKSGMGAVKSVRAVVRGTQFEERATKLYDNYMKEFGALRLFTVEKLAFYRKLVKAGDARIAEATKAGEPKESIAMHYHFASTSDKRITNDRLNAFIMAFVEIARNCIDLSKEVQHCTTSDNVVKADALLYALLLAESTAVAAAYLGSWVGSTNGEVMSVVGACYVLVHKYQTTSKTLAENKELNSLASLLKRMHQSCKETVQDLKEDDFALTVSSEALDSFSRGRAFSLYTAAVVIEKALSKLHKDCSRALDVAMESDDSVSEHLSVEEIQDNISEASQNLSQSSESVSIPSSPGRQLADVRLDIIEELANSTNTNV